MRRYAGLIGAGFIAFVGVVAVGPTPSASGAPALTPVVEAARAVTTGGDTNHLFILPQLAVDPANSNTIVLADGDYRAGGCGLFVSTNGGLVWTNPTDSLLPTSFLSCIVRPDTEPQITPEFTPDGKTLDVAMDATLPSSLEHGPISLAFASTPDLGLSHTSTVAIQSTAISGTDAGGPASAPAEYRSATIAVDPSDPSRIYVGSERGIDTVGLSKPNFGNEIPAVAVSTNGGINWGAPVNLGAVTSNSPHGPFDGYTPVLMVAKNGTVYAVAEGYSSGSSFPMNLYKSTDHGATWTASTIAGPQPSADEPAAAIDPATGNLYVAWDQQTPSMTQNIMFTRSTDGGATWSKPASLVAPAVASVSDRYFPGISVAPNGRVDVDWYDFRNDPFHPTGSSEQYADVYYTYSTDQGQTWANDIRVTPRSIDENLGVTFPDFAVETSTIASTNNSAMLAWPQPDPSEPGFQAEDDYFTRIDLNGAVTPSAKPASSTNKDVAWGVGGAAAALAFAGLVLLVSSRRRSAVPPAAP